MTAIIATASIKIIQEQSEKDSFARLLAYRQLEGGGDMGSVPIDRLTAAFRDASASERAEIYIAAEKIRHDNWRSKTDGIKIDRTVPVFAALVAVEDERFHRNHPSLGWALMHKSHRDFKAAEAALSKAIAIRDREGDRGRRIYELTRAVCRVMLDPEFQSGRASRAEQRQLILADLDAAMQDPNLKTLILRTPEAARAAGDPELPFQRWMQANAIAELTSS